MSTKILSFRPRTALAYVPTASAVSVGAMTAPRAKATVSVKDAKERALSCVSYYERVARSAPLPLPHGTDDPGTYASMAEAAINAGPAAAYHFPPAAGMSAPSTHTAGGLLGSIHQCVWDYVLATGYVTMAKISGVGATAPAGASTTDQALTMIGGPNYSTEVTLGTVAGAVAGFFGGGLLWSAVGGVAANLGGRYFAQSQCAKNGGAKCATQPAQGGIAPSGSGGVISKAADGSMSISVDPLVDGLFSDAKVQVAAGAVLAGRTAHLTTPSNFGLDALVVGYDTTTDGVALQLAKLPDGTPAPLVAILGGGGPSTFAVHRSKLQSVA